MRDCEVDENDSNIQKGNWFFSEAHPKYGCVVLSWVTFQLEWAYQGVIIEQLK